MTRAGGRRSPRDKVDAKNRAAVKAYAATLFDGSARLVDRVRAWFVVMEYRASVDPDALANVEAEGPRLGREIRAAGGSVRGEVLCYTVGDDGRPRRSLPFP